MEVGSSVSCLVGKLEKQVDVEGEFRYDGGMDIRGSDWDSDESLIYKGGRRGNKVRENGENNSRGNKGKDDFVKEKNDGFILLSKKEDVGSDSDMEIDELLVNLRILGNFGTDNQDVKHSKDKRLLAVSNLIKGGIRVEDLGVLLDVRESGDVYDRENSLRDVDKDEIKKIIENLTKVESAEDKQELDNEKRKEDIGGDHEELINQLTEEKIKERVRVANPRYQKSRLHYLGHRFNLIHPDETGLLVAGDNDDFNVGRLRLVEDLLRVTNGEGDLREVKDRLISVGVYVKDLENLSEKIKPMFQRREELLQKFYDDESKEELELLEKEIGEIFGVEIMHERIKSGERAQPKKEVEKKEIAETSENVKENLPSYFDSDLLFDDLYLLEFGSEDEKKEVKTRLEKEGVKIRDDASTYDYSFLVTALEDIKKRDFKRWSKDPQRAKGFVRGMLVLVKKAEGESENKSIEPQYYDGLYLDLWNAEYGEEVEKIKSRARLVSNNILPVEFGTDEVAKETYRMALEAIRNNKFVAWHNKREEAENYIKKTHGIKESVDGEEKENTTPAVETVEINKNIEYLDYLGNDLLVDMDRVYAGKDENGKWKYKENVSKVAMDRMTKLGLKLFMMPKKGGNGEIPHFRRGQRAINRVSDFLDGKEINREELSYFYSDLRTMGIKKEDLEEARKLRQGKSKMEEGKSVEKIVVDDERTKDVYFVELQKMATTEEWNRAMKEIGGYGEPQRSYAFGFMKVAYDWYMHPEKAMKDSQTMDRWGRTYVPILRKLGIKVDE